MFKDPIVEDVRKIRADLAKESGYDLHKILLDAKKAGKAFKSKRVVKPLRKVV